MSSKMKISEDDISIICSGEPQLWRTVITIHENNSLEQAKQVKEKILQTEKEYTK